MITPTKTPASTTSPSPPAFAAGRAYAELVGLFAIVLGPDVINALRDGWAVVFDGPPTWLAWWAQWVTPTSRVAFIVGMVWLIGLRPWKRLPPAVTVAGLVAIAGLRAAAVALAHPAPDASAWLTYLAQAALTVALAGAVARRRGLTLTELGLGRPPGHDRASAYEQARHVAVMSFLGITASTVAAWLVSALPAVPNPRGVFAVDGINDIPTMVAASLHAGIVEEVLLCASVVTALEAARRPAWQIYATGLAMRLAVHLTYGISAPAGMIFAAVNIWLYRRHRRLGPLVAAHVFFDLGAPLKILAGPFTVPAILAVAIAVDAVITRRAQTAPVEASTEDLGVTYGGIDR